MCRKPVGDGAKRVTMGVVIFGTQISLGFDVGLAPVQGVATSVTAFIANADAAAPDMWGSWPLLKDWTLAGRSCMGRQLLERFRQGRPCCHACHRPPPIKSGEGDDTGQSDRKTRPTASDTGTQPL